MGKYTFSGHESFHCKTTWLKRGFDFINDGHSFNDEDAVVKLGVGKNMVSSIRYWMKSFGLLNQDNTLTLLADFLYNDRTGKDKFNEDVSTLWLLHYSLVRNEAASIYNFTFKEFHKQRNEFEREHLLGYIKRRCIEDGCQYLYNENTVKKDIGVLLQNYVEPESRNHEEFTALLQGLNLIKRMSKNSYGFNYINHSKMTPEVFLHAIIQEKDGASVSFDLLLDIALVFCMTTSDLIDIINKLCALYSKELVYSDIAGIKQLQFKSELSEFEVLNSYYSKL